MDIHAQSIHFPQALLRRPHSSRRVFVHRQQLSGWNPVPVVAVGHGAEQGSGADVGVECLRCASVLVQPCGWIRLWLTDSFHLPGECRQIPPSFLRKQESRGSRRQIILRHRAILDSCFRRNDGNAGMTEKGLLTVRQLNLTTPPRAGRISAKSFLRKRGGRPHPNPPPQGGGDF